MGPIHGIHPVIWLLFCCLLPGGAWAKKNNDIQAEALQKALDTLLPLVAFVDAGWQYCSEESPQSKEPIAEAIRNWRLVNSIGTIDDLIAANAKSGNKMATLYGKVRNKQVFKIYRKTSGRTKNWCNGFPRLLTTPQWQLYTRFPAHFTTLRSFTRRISKSAPLPPAQPLTSVESPTYKQLQLARISPEKQLIPDAFHCYREKEGADYHWPDLIIQVSGKKTYQSSFGGGSYQMQQKGSTARIQWLSGPFKDRKSSLDYNHYGQSFQLSTRLEKQFHKFHCFQQGANDQYAQASFRLRHPQPGDYQCRDLKSGKQQTLKLTSHLGYRLGNARGSYKIEKLIGRPGESSSTIVWTSGPLAQKGKSKKARYSEEEGTGLRTLRFSTTWNRFVLGTGGSSSELSAICTAKGEPIHFQKYGAQPAPSPPKNAGGLEGFYYTMEDRFGYWEQESADAPRYYTFFPNGYVYEGEPEADPTETDCSQTLPNGAPLCRLYFIENGYIRIGHKKAEIFKKNGTNLQIGEKNYKPVPPSALAHLNGRFSHSSFSKWGTMDWGGSSYVKTVFTFTSDGRFYHQKEQKGTHSFDAGPTGMNIPGASIYGLTNNQDSNSGTYTINGHSITFNYNDGRVIRHFIWIKDMSSFYMKDRAFLKDDPEKGKP